MKLQRTNSGAHVSAVEIVKKYIGQLGDACTELEMDYFARIMQTDIALELRGNNLEAFSVKVREAI